MAPRFRWPILGIIIPCILISTLSYGSHFFIFRQTLSYKEQIWFEILITSLWISYALAINVNPGSPPKDFEPKPGEWRRWCKKCQNFKPERTHHCKSCNTCVLRMDHHCPWTNNCVGHRNLAHFLRFLVHVIIACTFVLIQLVERAMLYYANRDLPAYLIDKKEMVAVIVLLPIDCLVLLTIAILFFRCMFNVIFRGMTQIELWEMERLENQFYSERMWNQIRKNYKRFHGKSLPRLVSWNKPSNCYIEDASPEAERADDLVIPKEFTPDDIVFPFDMGPLTNMVLACGKPWLWILPCGGPGELGLHFPKNEYVEEDQLGLPWPPDGGHSEAIRANFSETSDIELNDINLNDILSLRKRLDPRSHVSRKEWINDEGETLVDFGVDIDAEDSENDDLVRT